MSDVETAVIAPRVRGVNTAWTLGIIVMVLLIAGGVFAYVFARDLHRWNTAIADKHTQILALKSEQTRQTDIRAQNSRELGSVILDTAKAKVPVDCAAKVQLVWNVIKARDFEHGGTTLNDMVRACQTNAGNFTITVRV